MSSCCCIEVDEPVVLLGDVTHTARTLKVCGECRQPIETGQKYTRETWVLDGDFGKAITCLFCRAIRRDFFPCGYYYGQMRDDFYECFGWDYVDGPAANDPAEAEDPLFSSAEDD